MTRLPRARRPLGPALVAAILMSLAGCDGGPPPTGTIAPPVAPDQAASQNEAVQEFLQPKMKSKSGAKKQRRRRPGARAGLRPSEGPDRRGLARP